MDVHRPRKNKTIRFLMWMYIIQRKNKMIRLLKWCTSSKRFLKWMYSAQVKDKKFHKRRPSKGRPSPHLDKFLQVPKRTRISKNISKNYLSPQKDKRHILNKTIVNKKCMQDE